ncbi:hypothetical protein TNCV_3625861 [Trichonephila clavipes]|nr:hypothetical protein TNCV_3625861 [Trichonephila clavipes]
MIYNGRELVTDVSKHTVSKSRVTEDLPCRGDNARKTCRRWSANSGVRKLSPSQYGGYDPRLVTEWDRWYWAQSHDMPVMIRYIDHWATADLRGHGTTLLRVKEDIEDVSNELGNGG